MADKRGADYNKRLNYDELKDKITKKKVPINAPYRTATVIRNSNQMQNLLNMNNLEMEEHNVKLQKEQVKQAAARDILNGNGTSSDYQSATNHQEHQNASEDLIDLYSDSADVLTQAHEEQKEKAIEQNKQTLGETGNLASKVADITLSNTKKLAQIGIAAAATAAAGGNPLVGGVAGDAAGSLLQAGYDHLTSATPGEEIDSYEVDVNEIIRNEKAQAKKMKPKEIFNEMEEAYKKGELTPAQNDTWVRITTQVKKAAQEKDKDAAKELNKIIFEEYVAYKLYSKGLFPSGEPDAEPGKKAAIANPKAKPKGRPKKDPAPEPKPAPKPKGRPKKGAASSSTD